MFFFRQFNRSLLLNSFKSDNSFFVNKSKCFNNVIVPIGIALLLPSKTFNEIPRLLPFLFLRAIPLIDSPPPFVIPLPFKALMNLDSELFELLKISFEANFVD